MRALALILLLNSLNTFGIEEATVLNEMILKLTQDIKCKDGSESFWQRKKVMTPLHAFSSGAKYGLRYSQFGCDLGDRGAVVIAPGRTESSPEYYETALDLIERGFSPVYVIDHRGQGLSPRVLENRFKSHVENFYNYISDFDGAVSDIQKDLKERGASKDNPLYYVSNSMGGGIGMGYFHYKGKNNPFKAAALLGSMIRVNYLSFIDKKPSFVNNRIYSEEGVIAQGYLACKVQNKCDQYAREAVFGDYKPGKRVFQEKPSVKEMEKYMTHSRARYDLKTYIWEEMDWATISNEEYKGENWKDPQLGGSTFSWTFTATKFLKKMRSKKFIKNLPDMPILIMTGTNDFRAYKPYKDGSHDLSRHKDFCDNINKHNSFEKKLCTFAPLQDAFHEILKESDVYREKAIESLEDFFTSNR